MYQITCNHKEACMTNEFKHYLLNSLRAYKSFLEHHGYRGWSTCLVFERRLEKYEPVEQPRQQGPQ